MKAEETYTLDKEIAIKTAMTIQTESTAFNTDSTEMGLKMPPSKLVGLIAYLM
ncbi:hypothetical protein [Acinetobacter sp.]|uniref:hypothetical protein n=1 Tax=Acinetobacter sp. TaxID=472 RepID=UPI0035AFBC2D